MSNTFSGYGLFGDIRNPHLRAFNRVSTFLNIKERHGSESARAYLKKIDHSGKIAVFKTMQEIASKGFEQARRDIMRKNNG